MKNPVDFVEAFLAVVFIKRPTPFCGNWKKIFLVLKIKKGADKIFDIQGKKNQLILKNDFQNN
jgi:hypothetical protein